MAHLLVVDDDKAVGQTLCALLTQTGYHSTYASKATEGLRILSETPIDLVLLDLRMPQMDGLEFLREMRSRGDETPVVMLTAHGRIEAAVEAMKRGAADFLSKPADKETLAFTIGRALSVNHRFQVRPPEAVVSTHADSSVDTLIEKAARSDANVLIRGESGTGKEVAARRIHELSRRSTGPLVKIHCAAIPDHLLESELFGFEKGAFTGATSRKPGRFELAAGGTIFLDEIGDVSSAVQVKLLRVLQDREFERLGGTHTVKTDARFVAATHRDLEKMVANGDFREDLYYRLNVIPIELTPLRSRLDEIPSLASRFCTQFAASNQVERRLDESAIAALMKHTWPGNIRELQNLIERIVVLSDEQVVGHAVVETMLGQTGQAVVGASDLDESKLESAVKQAEKEAITAALRSSGGNRTQAARLLGISRRSLYYKIESYQIALP